MKKRVVIVGDVDRTFDASATRDPRLIITRSPAQSEEDLVRAAGEADVLVTRAYNRITPRVIDAGPSLELIAQGTSGTDNIDEGAASQRRIRIVSLPGENANAVAELVVGFMLSMTRTVPAYTREMTRGPWQRDDCASRHELRHHRLGIAGLGYVGSRVARLASAFGMRCAAFDPYRSDDYFQAQGVTRASSLNALLAGSDILTLHVPLNSETRQIVGKAEIGALARGSYLVNASRGGVLDQEAALSALESGHLAGLALDVFDPEPPVRPFPDDPRLILTPHIAGCSHECKAAIGEKLYRAICRFYWPEGEQIPSTTR